tara:strand:+ start:2882 stop:3070 length:189 start_codon:yes stop_codon:yes gene_type:complete
MGSIVRLVVGTESEEDCILAESVASLDDVILAAVTAAAAFVEGVGDGIDGTEVLCIFCIIVA